MAFDTQNWNFTSDDSAEMHRHQADRLKVQLDRQITAFEATDNAEEHARIEKSVKALIALNKAVKEVYAADPKPSKSKDMRDDEMNDDTEATDLAEYKSRAIAEDPRCAEWADWQFKLERKLIDLDRNRRNRSGQEDPEQTSRTDGARTPGGVEDIHRAARADTA